MGAATQVLSGELAVQVSGQWQTLRAGETMRVPPGVPHTIRHDLAVPTRVFNTHQPALRTEDYFDLGQVISSLTHHGQAPLKQDLTTGTYLSILFKRYPAELVALAPLPAVIAVLNLLGKLRGFRLSAEPSAIA